MAIGIASGISSLATVVTTIVLSLTQKDNEKREEFTKEFVKQASQQYPDYNVVITCSPHRQSGNSIIHQHVELPLSVGTRGYEVYFSPKGQPFEFVLEGDGGYINWAYSGDFTRNEGTLTAN